MIPSRGSGMSASALSGRRQHSREQIVELGGRETDRGVGGAVVEAQFARLLIVDESARKDRVRHVAAAFVRLERPEHPVRRATEDSAGLLEIEQRKTVGLRKGTCCPHHPMPIGIRFDDGPYKAPASMPPNPMHMAPMM